MKSRKKKGTFYRQLCGETSLHVCMPAFCVCVCVCVSVIVFCFPSHVIEERGRQCRCVNKKKSDKKRKLTKQTWIAPTWNSSEPHRGTHFFYLNKYVQLDSSVDSSYSLSTCRFFPFFCLLLFAIPLNDGCFRLVFALLSGWLHAGLHHCKAFLPSPRALW